VDISRFELSTSFGGFGLNRMESMMSMSSQEFLELLEREPVEVDFRNGKYEIRNGRHRVARAIIDGCESIFVIVL
jgi:hypothetical protein